MQLEVLTEDRPGRTNPWEKDIQLVRDARLGIREYAPGSQVIANGRVWESYGIGQYPKHFMPTRHYRECPQCRHVQIEMAREDFDAACPVCSHPILPTQIRSFIEPKSFVTSSAEPNGKDPGLTRLRPPPTQEARLLSAAPDTAFAVSPANVSNTSWAWQDAKQGRMFVVNKGRNFGFLRCSCGFAEMLRNPVAHVVEIQARGHRSPYNQPCTLNSWHTEDLAHEFHTDVLQIRMDQPIPLPANLRPEEIDGWRDGFVRTLVEAVRLGAVNLLGIDQRELCGTARSRIFGYPEVVLYDSVAGGAGYCQMLTARFAMRDLLKNALEVLRCKAECSHSCRTCLQGYENQIHWDKLNRKPVLAWLERALNINQAENPFDRFKAAPLNVTNGSAILQAELESANHLLIVAPRLFNLQKDATNENYFGTPETVAFAKKLVSWMTAGKTLEIALPEPPLIHADFPNSIWVAERLKTSMEDGSLKLCRLPASFDPRQWPRAVVNPDKNGSRAFFSTSLVTDGFLDLPLPTPLWKGPSPDAAALQAMRVGWVTLDSKALRIPKDTTLLEYAAGQSRDYIRDFAFCKSKSFAVVRIEDPFILKTDWNYKQLKRFLEIIFPIMAACPTKFELRTRVSEEPDQKLMIQDLEKWLKSKGASFSFQLVPVFGFGKKDFHDRRLVFQPEQSNTKKRITVLMTGGIDRYLDSKFECSIVIQT